MASVPQGHVAVEGSERPPVADARRAGDVDPKRRIEVTVTVRARTSDEELERLAVAPMQGDGEHVDREGFAERHGAAAEDLERVEQFAREHGLEVVESSAARRAVALAGTISEMADAFGVSLALYEHPELGTYRGRTGPVYIPQALGQVVTGVFGLDDRPQAEPHFRRREIPDGEFEPHAAPGSFAPNEVARLYDFPSEGNGEGQTVAVIELGGGFRMDDLSSYFAGLGIAPEPQVTAVAVDGADNTPTGDPNGPDGEVMLDIEVIGAVAPGARIVVYFAPNSTRGFLDAVSMAIHDAQNSPSVVSISWGQAEGNWTEQALRAFDRAFKEAGALGVSVCCASGDDGSNDNINDGHAHVDFPAASPFVLACGGTRLESTGAQIREVVWHEPGGGASGGGISEFFTVPAYQQSADVPPSVNPGHKQGRGVPDVAGDADPGTGYKIRVDGRDAVFGGTSAVAPLYAALIAIINQQRGRSAGFLNPVLYGQPAAGAFRDVVSGDNGAYHARPGWDPCTGLGSPDGSRVLSAI
jgi:kumamolisin